MRIVSWNVNGLRACSARGFGRFLNKSKADIVGIQEVRAFPHQLEAKVLSPKGWHAHFVAGERAGYSGVGLYSRVAPDRVESTLNDSQFDKEGRVLIAHFGRLVVATIYFPKGSGK